MEETTSNLVLWDSTTRATKGKLGPPDGTSTRINAIHPASTAPAASTSTPPSSCSMTTESLRRLDLAEQVPAPRQLDLVLAKLAEAS